MGENISKLEYVEVVFPKKRQMGPLCTVGPAMEIGENESSLIIFIFSYINRNTIAHYIPKFEDLTMLSFFFCGLLKMRKFAFFWWQSNPVENDLVVNKRARKLDLEELKPLYFHIIFIVIYFLLHIKIIFWWKILLSVKKWPKTLKKCEKSVEKCWNKTTYLTQNLLLLKKPLIVPTQTIYFS